MAYRLAPQAEADLEDIAFYVFVDSGSIEIADRLIQSITERSICLPPIRALVVLGMIFSKASVVFPLASTLFCTASKLKT